MTVLVVRNFETGDLSEGWNKYGVPRSSKLEVVTGNRRAGSYGCKVDLYASDDFSEQGARSELGVRFNPSGGFQAYNQLIGETVWYGWSVKLDGAAYGYDNEPEIIAQWYVAHVLSSHPNPPVSIWIKNAKINLRFRGDSPTFAWSVNQIVNEWIDFVVHAKWSSTGTGFFHLYMNGSLVYSRTNWTAVEPGELGVHFKFGIYKWKWKLLNGPSDVSYRKLWLDELRIADGSSVYADVAPAGGSGVPGGQPPPVGPPPPAPPAAPTDLVFTSLISKIYVPQSFESDQTPIFGFTTIDTTQEARAFCVQVKKAGNIRRVHFRTGAVGLGATLSIRIESLLDNLPSGSLFSSGSECTHVVGDADDNTWHRTTQLVNDAVVVRGDMLAIVIENSVASPGNIQISTLDELNQILPSFPYLATKTLLTWSPTTQAVWPVCALEYDDGTVDEICPYIYPLSDIVREDFESNGASGKSEIALKFRMPYAGQLLGFHTQGVATGATGPYDVILYSENGAILATQRVETSQIGAFSEYRIFASPIFDEEGEVQASEGLFIQGNTWYRLGFKSLDTGGVSFYTGEVAFDYLMDAWNGGRDMYYSERLFDGAWIDNPLKRIFGGLIFSEIVENLGAAVAEAIDLEIQVFDPNFVNFEVPVTEATATPTAKRLFPNNWEGTEVEVETVYLTDVVESEGSAEERRGLVSNPNRTQKVRLTGLDQSDSQRLHLFFQKLSNNRLEIPLYSDVTALTADAAGADTVIQCDTRYRRFYPGDKVTIHDWRPGAVNNAAFKIIQSKTDSSITLTTALGGPTLPRGSRVYPTLDCEKNLLNGFQNITDTIIDAELNCIEIIGPSAIQYSVAGLPAGEPTQAGYPILVIEPDWDESPQTVIERAGFSYNQGKGFIVTSKGLRPKLIFTIQMQSERPEFWRILNFFDSRRGRNYAFWLLSKASLWIPTNIQTTFIEIAKTGELTDVQDFFDYIGIIVRATGETLIREISTVADMGSVFRVNLVTPLPSAYALSEITRCTSAHFVRFNTDALLERWISNGLCDIELEAIETLAEKTIVIGSI